MSRWESLVCELAAHKIVIDDAGSFTLHAREGSKQFSSAKEIATFLKNHASSNSEFLLKLWQEVSRHQELFGEYPVNDGTRRLFVSAMKHLVRLSSESKILNHHQIHNRLSQVLETDANNYTEDDMNRFIGYRLAIDWVSYIVAYDLYRASLCMATLNKEKETNDSPKTAGVLSQDLSFTEMQPWKDYELHDPRRGGEMSEKSLTQDPTNEENQRSMSRFNDNSATLVGRAYSELVGEMDPLLPSPWLKTEDSKGPANMLSEDQRDKGWQWGAEGEVGVGSMRASLPGR